MAANFTSANPSIQQGLSDWVTYGGMIRTWASRVATTTAATTTSGSVSGARCPNPLTIPSVGAGVQGYILSMGDVAGSGLGMYSVNLEYLLGTLTLSGNSFSSGASMPTKTVLGTSLTTASSQAWLVVTTTGTATTPTITITYTNQDGVTNQSISVTLPTSPLINSAFNLNQALFANSDTGIRAVTGMSSSVTTGALVLGVYGCLLLNPAFQQTVVNTPQGSSEPLLTPTFPLYLCAASDTVNVYRASTIATGMDIVTALAFCPEPS